MPLQGEPAQVLIVCTGNVCRSPFIERVLAASLPPGSGVVVSSAGTGALVGRPMEPLAAAQTQRYAGSPAGFAARQLVPGLVASADLVLTATRRHRGEVATLHPRALSYAFTLVDFADLVADLDPEDLAAGAGMAPGASAFASRASAFAPNAVPAVADAGAHGASHPGEGAAEGARPRIQALVRAAAARRGLNPPRDAADVDIVDPFRGDEAMFDAMAQQVMGALPVVARALAG